MKPTLIINGWGDKKYILNGKLHNPDGPALELGYGSNFYYLNGLLHREDGPAHEYDDNAKFWYINGLLHRTDGPAVEAFGHSLFYLNGTNLTYNKWTQLVLPNSIYISTYKST